MLNMLLLKLRSDSSEVYLKYDRIFLKKNTLSSQPHIGLPYISNSKWIAIFLVAKAKKNENLPRECIQGTQQIM